MDSTPTPSRRQFLATSASAAAALTIVPRHVLGGPRFVAPSDKVNIALIGAGGQGLHNARALFQEDDCQIIALADPAEEWDLSKWYYGGKSGRGPGKALIEAHYREKTPNASCAVSTIIRANLLPSTFTISCAEATFQSRHLLMRSNFQTRNIVRSLRPCARPQK